MPIAVLFTLSLSTFANTGLNEKITLSENSNTNLVELFKKKEHANEYIKNIEEKLRSTNTEEQEELLVELAQSLLYYLKRHNQRYPSNALNANGLNSENIILNKALNAYKKASGLALNKNQKKYTRELSELTVSLHKKNELIQIFDGLLQYEGDEIGTYLAHIDYADGLTNFKDNAAETQFLSAINMRTPVDGIEANFRYANYLLDTGKQHEALGILEKFTLEERNMYAHVALLRQKTIHILKLDTREVDTEIELLRKNLSNIPFIGEIPKFTSLIKNTPTYTLGLPIAYAFAHNNERDDSRGKYNSRFSISPLLYAFSTDIVNAAEVIYNESRGAKQQGRYAVGWAIRNRATINMNDCDFYPGAEGHPRVSTCRAKTPDGPISLFSETFKRYSCVVHGGTTNVGASHSQMNDAHVSFANLESSGIIWEMLYVMNGWTPDPSGPYFFFAAEYPDKDLSTGNPEGIQEWNRGNYCAKNNFCKIRLGNVGGNNPDPGNICSEKRKFGDDYNTDNFFWGRKGNSFTLDIIVE